MEALKGSSREDEIAFLSQALATRYYPLTRTDRRTFTLSDRRFDWSWHAFARDWDAKQVASELGVSGDKLADQQQWLVMLASNRDPLDRWYHLVSFIAVAKKDELKGAAQFAQLLYAIEHMLRLFAKDGYALDLHPPYEDPTSTNTDIKGKRASEDPRRHLEFVVNAYHLNPRPKLILVVEGESEEAVIPRIAEQVFGHSFFAREIEVRTLGGVGEYTGSKKHDKHGALEKFIDDYHYRQTVVFVVLDKEGRVDEVTKRLRKARSKLYPLRMLTCPEYIYVWTRNIEFDNFTPDEIAESLTTQANGKYAFSADEIEEAKRAYDGKTGDPLARLYREKVAHNLDKIACLRTLSEILIAAVKGMPHPEQLEDRPILKVLKDVTYLAGLNHQPTRRETWSRNQESGYFGKLVAPVAATGTPEHGKK